MSFDLSLDEIAMIEGWYTLAAWESDHDITTGEIALLRKLAIELHKMDVPAAERGRFE